MRPHAVRLGAAFYQIAARPPAKTKMIVTSHERIFYPSRSRSLVSFVNPPASEGKKSAH
jgi:hypothetical protein